MNLVDVLPQFFPREWQDAYSIYGIPFTEDVSLGFVVREAGGYSYVLEEDAENTSLDALLETGLGNLAGFGDNKQLHSASPPGATVIWLTADDNFIAVRLLLPKVQEFIRRRLGESFLFTIPSRDQFLAWDLDAPLDTTLKHAQVARADFDSDEYNLSPHVYVYSEQWPCKPHSR